MEPGQPRTANSSTAIEILSRVVSFRRNSLTTEDLLIEARERWPIARNQIRVNVFRADARVSRPLRTRRSAVPAGHSPDRRMRVVDARKRPKPRACGWLTSPDLAS